ncbi:MAG: hypothetical protein U0326_03960 [Polyangiales bacterium]
MTRSTRVRMTLLACVAGAAVSLANPSRAAANGRFPTGGYFVVGGGAARGVMVLRATFGLLASRDGGSTWAWVCEESFGAVGTFDASVAIGASGRVVLTTPRGLRASDDGCAWAPPAGSVTRPFIDVSVDATGSHMVTVAGPSGVDDVILRSRDGGASWTRGATLPGLYASTIEVAPSNPMRVYVGGFLADGTALLLRSDDGGATAREIARDAAFLGGTSAYVSGVDPRDPDVLYVRASVGLGVALLRSDDGGATFRELTRSEGAMTGFALSDDGETVWVGSDDRRDALRRSTRGGPFERLPVTVTTRCLRQRDGVLYVCTDEAADGALLACSTDGGEHLTVLVSARSLSGPPTWCTAESPVSSLCGPLWPSQRAALASIDGGAPFTPGSHDASLDAPVDARIDARETPDAPSHDASSDVTEYDQLEARDVDVARDLPSSDNGLDGATGPAPSARVRAQRAAERRSWGTVSCGWG